MSEQLTHPSPDQAFVAKQQFAVETVDPSLQVAESTQETPRQLLIDAALSPYHIHFAEGIEGHAINPEAAERNFDILLLATKLIREKRTINPKQRANDNDSESELIEQWFFDTYESTGLTKQDFNRPNKIIELWLKKLGPHNDMADAYDDLYAARTWLLDVSRSKGAQSEASIDEVSKEFGLIAELDIELAELADTHEKIPYLQEAAGYLSAYIRQKEKAGETTKATLARMKLASVKIDIKRAEIFGSTLPTANVEEDSYAVFEECVETELDDLEEHFEEEIERVRAVFDAEEPTEDIALAQSRLINMVRKIGPLFEVYTYLEVMQSFLQQGTLVSQKIRPGTIREESGTSHKVNDLPKNKVQGEQGDNPTTEHGFNYNFDLVVISMPDATRDTRQGLYTTYYYQNKIDESYAPADSAKAASAKFFANKNYFYIQPKNFGIEPDLQEDQRLGLKRIMDAMHPQKH